MPQKSQPVPKHWTLSALGIGKFDRRELNWLIIGLGACVLLWIFLILAGEIAEGETQAFDIRILRALRSPDDPATPLGPAWMEGSLPLLQLFRTCAATLWGVRRRVSRAVRHRHRAARG